MPSLRGFPEDRPGKVDSHFSVRTSDPSKESSRASTASSAPAASGAWAGLDLGSNASARIAKVRYCPRSGLAARMVGGKFQGANSSDFSDASDLFTVATAPADAALTTQEISNTGAFRYLRYLSSATGSCNVAEIEFHKFVGMGATTLYAFENNANDTSGNGNNGTPSGITYVTGKVGSYAANFNGTTAYVGSSLRTAGDFSVALWVKTTGSSSAGTSTSQWWAGRGLVDGDVNGNAADWGTSITNGSFAFGIGAATAATSDVTVKSSATINDNAWHHCVATWVMSTGAMAVYVDGVLSGSGTSGAGAPRLSPITLKLGRTASGSGNVSLNGALDDVRYFNRMLAGSEIASLAAASAPASAPTTPASLTATAGDGQVALAWPASSGAVSYAVVRTITSGAGYTTIDTTTGTNFVDVSANSGVTYFYVVTAANLSGVSGNSPEAVATPLGLPAVPTNLTAIPGAEQNALSWSDVANATGYTVLRGVVSGGPYTTVRTLSGTSPTDTGITSGIAYYYVVTATNAVGTGGYSGQASATPLSQQQAWRLAHFGTIDNTGNAADSADPDGDGWTNAQEFASGTDPNDRTSLLKVDQMKISGSDLLLSFPTVSGKTYRVERSDTLQTGSWATVQADIPGTGGTVQVADAAGAAQPKRFYRIVITP